MKTIIMGCSEEDSAALRSTWGTSLVWQRSPGYLLQIYGPKPELGFFADSRSLKRGIKKRAET